MWALSGTKVWSRQGFTFPPCHPSFSLPSLLLHPKSLNNAIGWRGENPACVNTPTISEKGRLRRQGDIWRKSMNRSETEKLKQTEMLQKAGRCLKSQNVGNFKTSLVPKLNKWINKQILWTSWLSRPRSYICFSDHLLKWKASVHFYRKARDVWRMKCFKRGFLLRMFMG